MIDSQATTEEKSFLKKLFNWKYLIILIIIQSILVYFTIELSKIGQNGLGLLLLVVMYYLSKRLSTSSEKILNSSLQWSSIFLYGLITILIYGVFVYNEMDKSSSSSKVEYVMNAMLQEANNLPKKLNESIELFRVSKMNDHTIMQDLRYFEYTKDEILSAYNSDINLYKKEMTESVLPLSCQVGKSALSLGIVVINTYFGKDNQSIIRIQINNKNCIPYYTQNTK